jgi:hypothetical protein
MRRAVLLLATVALGLLLVGGVAVSKQQQGTTSSKSPATTTSSTKSGGDVSIQSTTVKASSASGSGPTFLRVGVSDHGNLLAFESPQGHQSVSSEGYALCSYTGSWTTNGYDYTYGEAGFGTPTFAQPNGAGTFPLTVTRNTTDGKFQLKQVWSKPDAIEKDVTVTMTVTNRSSSTADTLLSRTGDIDAGGYDSIGGTGFTDRGTRTNDSDLQWDDYGDGTGSVAMGLTLTALTFQTSHTPWLETQIGWNPTQCHPTNAVFGVASRQDLAMRMNYSMLIPAGASKTVKYEYGRM